MTDSSAARGTPPPAASPHRQTLLTALSDQEVALGEMYRGAVAALAYEYPEAIAQCAHSIRELLEKLPTYFDVPKERSGPSLTEAAKGLKTDLDRAKQNSKCWSGSAWDGNLDGALKRFLKRAEMFMVVLDEMKPPRRGEAQRFLREVDSGPYPLPQSIEEIRLAEWERYRSFFQGVAHHQNLISRDEFLAMFWRCEEFLLNQLVPRTYEDRSTIANIVAEVERGD